MTQTKTQTQTQTTGAQVTFAEITRDERMVVLGLLRDLIALTTQQLSLALANDRVHDPIVLRQEIEQIVARSRNHQRRLNDARINRRAVASSRHPTSPLPPPRVLPFARNGDYIGEFDHLGAVARACSPTHAAIPAELTPHLDLHGQGLALHLNGSLWTLADGGKVHVFRCTQTGTNTGDAESNQHSSTT